MWMSLTSKSLTFPSLGYSSSLCDYETAYSGVHGQKNPSFTRGRGEDIFSRHHSFRRPSAVYFLLQTKILEDCGRGSIVWMILFLNALHLKRPHSKSHQACFSSFSWPCELSWNQSHGLTMPGLTMAEGTGAAGSDSPDFNPGSIVYWLCDLR